MNISKTARKCLLLRNLDLFKESCKDILRFLFPRSERHFLSASAFNLCDPYYDYKFQSYDICQMQSNRPKLPNELPIQLIHRDFIFSRFFTFELNSRLLLTL